MEEIYKLIIESAGAGKIDKQTAVALLKVMKQDGIKANEDIAIIGMSARFPGASDINQFWNNIIQGLDHIKELPERRKEDTNQFVSQFFSSDCPEYDHGAYLDEIDMFDPAFFRLSPKEASLMDPSQRLFLQTVWQAIEDAGYAGKKLAGSRTGVYVGYATNTMYIQTILQSDPSLVPSAMVGNIAAMIPSRISYLLDLKGPTMILDTACSSSVVALHLACQSLKLGECDMAIAGGIKLHYMPTSNENMKIGIESSDHRTRAFDESADGSGIGEGVAAVLVKPLKAALRDKDHIYAVIKGGALNQDGNSIGITAPNPAAQADVISTAWENARISPETISYIETHGTGTHLGDPIEIEGLERAFRKYTDKHQFCAISSIKTNIGHLYECAGMAGLIKSVLALKKQMLPPQIHFQHPNKKIQFYQSPVYVNTKARHWDVTDHPRRCGVSAFGLSGTNCHLVLEEAPSREQSATSSWQVLTLSAKSTGSLQAYVQRYLEHVQSLPELHVGEMCYTANTGRGHYNYRLYLLVNGRDDLLFKLQQMASCDTGHWESIEGVGFGGHKTLKESKTNAPRGVLSEGEQQDLTQITKELLSGFIEAGKTNHIILEEICKNYIKGAEIDWESLYRGEGLWRTSLPTYPFDQTRCWLEASSELSPARSAFKQVAPMHYETYWVPQKLVAGRAHSSHAEVLIFTELSGLGMEIAERLREGGTTIIFVSPGQVFRKIDENQFEVAADAESYQRLWHEISHRNPVRIIHCYTADDHEEIQSEQALETWQQRGVMSLLYLVQQWIKRGADQARDVVLLTRNAMEVTGRESRIYPEHALMPGLGKVVVREQEYIRCRSIDVDEETTAEAVLYEIAYGSQTGAMAYRNGLRYMEVFDQVNFARHNETPLAVQENGVYVVVGGLGGIGLEIGRWLASKHPIKLAFVGRKVLPPREQWNAIIAGSEDEKLRTRIQAIRDIETNGTEVLCFQASITDYASMQQVIATLKAKFGSIQGVVQSAGIARDRLLAEKHCDEFCEVLSPKVQGTWILDQVTCGENLDFFIVFSSIATVFSAICQGDYVAANAYQNAFAAYRNKLGKRTLSINWTTWKETGMAADAGFTVDTIFKAMPTQEAIAAFAKAFTAGISKVIIGELNTKGGLQLLEKSNMPVSSEIEQMIQTSKKKTEALSKHKAKTVNGAVRLSGRDNNEYSIKERIVGQIWGEKLGFQEIDLFDNFYELGGDSILGLGIVNRINQELNVSMDIVDLLKFPTIEALVRHLEEQNQVVRKEQTANKYPAFEVVSPAEYYPLSPAQRGLFLLDQLDGVGTSYNLPFGEIIHGPLDILRFENAVRLMIDRHESLRTSFHFVDGHPVQKIHAQVPFRLEVLEAREDDILKNQRQWFETYIRPFDLGIAPLLRMALVRIEAERHILIIDLHHIITDGISNEIYFHDLNKFYIGETLPPLDKQYKEYAVWFQKLEQTPIYQAQKQFWINQFSGEIPLLHLPVDYPRLQFQNFEGGHLSCTLGADLTKGIRRLANDNGATLYMVLMALINTLLYRYTGQSDMVVGSPIAGRLLSEFEKITGMFVNVLAMRNFPEGKQTFKQFLDRVKQVTLDAYSNQYYPFPQLVEQVSPRRDLSRNPIFDIMFVLQNYEVNPEDSQYISTTSLSSMIQVNTSASKFDIAITAIESDEGIKFDVEYCAKLFREETMLRFMTHFENIVREVIANPNEKLSALQMLGTSEEEQILSESSGHYKASGQLPMFHQAFEAQAANAPCSMAAISKQVSYTYAEVNQLANRIAHRLLEMGAKPGQRVGLAIDRSAKVVPGVLGILKSGAVLVAIGTNLPEERIRFMVEDSDIQILITQRQFQEAVTASRLKVIYIDDEEIGDFDSSNLQSLIQPNDTAYIIYTSGTTGTPKGVCVSHGSLASVMEAWREAYHLHGAKKNVLQIASFSFDVFIGDLVRALSNGGQLVICTEKERTDMPALAGLLREHRIQMVESTPSLLLPLMDYVYENGVPIPSLELLILGSDTLSVDDFRRLHARFGDHIRIINSYGVTEATIDSSCFDNQQALPDVGTVPIGRPLSNTRMYILNSSFCPQPDGVIGELFIGGAGVAKGYLNQTKMTQERFIPDKWYSGELMYSTGDLAKRLPDGNIQFIGRADEQIKIRGYRIETDEIKSKLLSNPLLREAEVVVREVQDSVALCAYFTSNEEVDPNQIKDKLVRELPEYMIPKYFIQIPDIPLTRNGKVDKKALPVPEAHNMTTQEYIKPRNEIETKMAVVWARVLGLDQVGILDNFFDIGGDSIKAIHAVAELSKHFKIKINDLLLYQTIEQLAQNLIFEEKEIHYH